MNLWKPYFIHRPRQIPLRIIRGFWKPEAATVSLPWGGRLLISPRESVGSAIWLTGVHEIATTEAIFRLLPKNGVGLDIGANIGYMTSAMAAASGNGGTVMSFEPHPAIFEKLQFNANQQLESNCAKIRLWNLALSDNSGSAMLSLDPDNSNQGMGTINPLPGAHHIEVETARLDDLVPGINVDLLKIDVEGHELQALRGADQLLRQGRVRHLIFEDHNGAGGPVQAWLEELGFSVFSLNWRVSGPMLAPPGNLDSHSSFQASDFLATLAPDSAKDAFSAPGWRCLMK